MRDFHITYTVPDEFMAKGKTYRTETEIEALIIWREEFGDATFLYLSSDEIFKYKFN